jgi:hypothetical protein
MGCIFPLTSTNPRRRGETPFRSGTCHPRGPQSKRSRMTYPFSCSPFAMSSRAVVQEHLRKPSEEKLGKSRLPTYMYPIIYHFAHARGVGWTPALESPPYNSLDHCGSWGKLVPQPGMFPVALLIGKPSFGCSPVPGNASRHRLYFFFFFFSSPPSVSPI